MRGLGFVTSEKTPGSVRLNAHRLLEARKRAGLSREKLAELARGRLTLSVATIKRAEKGRLVHLETARCLAELLSVSLEYLLSSADNPDWSGPNPANGAQAALYPPLAGRTLDLSRALESLQRAQQGNPTFVQIVGEPGIGKTRLLRELCLRAKQAGLTCGIGGGQEHLGIPFAAITEALVPLELRMAASSSPADAERLRAFVRSGAPPQSSAMDERALLTLFRTLTDALLRATERQPLLLAIDDVQWTDQSSFELFEKFVLAAAEASWRGERCGLILVVTIRSDARSGQIGQRLARLSRESLAVHIELRGLDRLHTFDLLQGLSIDRPSQTLTNTVHESTAGNPLFVQELVRLLAEQGELDERGGYTVLSRPSNYIRLPESITAAIAQRCRDLSDDCRRALSYGACLGMQFELTLLAQLTNQDVDELLDLLQDAFDEQLIDSKQQTLAFTHPLVRQVCRQLVTEARRQRIHYAIAQWLLQQPIVQLEAALHELAYHLIEAGPLADAAHVLEYASRAGAQAEESLAWDAAVRFFGAATQSTAVAAPIKAQFHLRIGLAHFNAYEVGLALEHYAEAERIFETLGDRRGRVRALNDRTRLAMTAGLRQDVEKLELELPRLITEDPRFAAEVMNTLSDCYVLRKDQQRAREHAESATGIAKQLADDALGARVSNSLALCYFRNLSLREAIAEWSRGYELAKRADEPIFMSRYLQRLPLAQCPLGLFSEAENACDQAWAFHQQVPNVGESSLISHARAWLALVRGNLGEAIRHATESIAAIRRSSYVLVAPLVVPTLACAYALRGQWREADATLLQLPELTGEGEGTVPGSIARYRALIAGYQSPEVIQTELRASRPSGSPPVQDLARIARVCAQVELAQLGGHALPRDCTSQLEAAQGLGIVFTNTWVFTIARVLGNAYASDNEWHRAELQFEQSLEVTRMLGAKTEHARTCLDYAILLAGRPRTSGRAREFGQRAVRELGALEMVPLAQRAKALLARL